ncbi:hypothetical protein GOBAR_DD14031 [Gossypium barbadense]|nr:hypothetical protein GOBAR_DD14031 [Gossypium barbadense]
MNYEACHGLRVNKEDISSFGGWLEEIFSLFKGNMQNALDMKLRIAFTCWIIWKEQCEAIFNGSSVSDKRAINRVKIGMVELCELQNKQSDCRKKTTSNNRETLLWWKPETDWLKINVDSAFEYLLKQDGIESCC